MFYDKKQNSTMAPADQCKPKMIDLLEKYLDVNTKMGYLIFQVYEDSPVYGSLPVTNARISLCKCLGDEFYVCIVLTTDMNGKTEPIPVPTVNGELFQSPENGIANAEYDICIDAPGFERYEKFRIPVYEGITSIQNAVLSPVI
ncbi:MAG: hypothetical protein AAGU75_01850 [Bacillota bacterium]